MPIRLCSLPTCANPAVTRGRCQQHASQYNRDTHARFKHVYNSKRWRLTRRRQLMLHPLCEQCGRIATDVHHRVDLAAGGPPFAFANLESLCHEHHSVITRQRQGISHP